VTWHSVLQVPSTAVSLNLLNFDSGILDRRTYVVCSDGNVGYGCCFTPDMKGVTWRPGKVSVCLLEVSCMYINNFSFS
jgi:hypothetical protein